MATETVTDAVTLLIEDHNKVPDLFKRFESSEGKAKEEVFREIAMELEVHTKIEEEIFYPAVRKGLTSKSWSARPMRSTTSSTSSSRR